MPAKILKGTLEYCLGNKLFFIYVLVQLFIFECITNEVGGIMKTTSLIVLLVVLGYGLKVTKDVANGGTCLPKIKFNELINFGLKGIVVYTFYLTIQASVLGLISMKLNFPEFDLEELILKIPETVHLFYEHDPTTFILFILLGLITVYVTVFFMEIALAKLADGGKLKDAFDFRSIKEVIEVIGWNSYAKDYTEIVLSIVILMAVNIYFRQYSGLNIIISVITDMLIFVVEYRGIGLIYREYQKNESEKSST